MRQKKVQCVFTITSPVFDQLLKYEANMRQLIGFDLPRSGVMAKVFEVGLNSLCSVEVPPVTNGALEQIEMPLAQNRTIKKGKK